jgi:hypothetical protein
VYRSGKARASAETGLRAELRAARNERRIREGLAPLGVPSAKAMARAEVCCPSPALVGATMFCATAVSNVTAISNVTAVSNVTAISNVTAVSNVTAISNVTNVSDMLFRSQEEKREAEEAAKVKAAKAEADAAERLARAEQARSSPETSQPSTPPLPVLLCNL